MRRGDGIDTCWACGGTDLFDSFTEEGREGEQVTVCNECGQEQDRPARNEPRLKGKTR